MNGSRKYRVLIIEPSPIFSQGLREMISSDGRFSVVGEESAFIHVAERLPVLSPDIIVANPGTPDMPEPDALRASYPLPSYTVLVSVAYSCVREDIMKRYDENISVYDDAHTVLRKLTYAMEQHSDDDPVSEKYDLSSREKEILVSVARGLMNKEIADKHNISIHTVITHRKNITRKTGIKTVAGLTIYAILNGMIDMGDVE